MFHTITISWRSLLTMSKLPEDTQMQSMHFVNASHHTNQYWVPCPLATTYSIHSSYALHACQSISNNCAICKATSCIKTIILDLYCFSMDNMKLPVFVIIGYMSVSSRLLSIFPCFFFFIDIHAWDPISFLFSMTHRM